MRNSVKTQLNFEKATTWEIILGSNKELYKRYKVGLWQSVAALQFVTIAYLGARIVGLA